MDRRNFIQTSMIAGAGTVMLTGTQCQSTSEKPLAGKHVLFVYGGWEGHNPEGCRDLYVPWMESEGARVTVSDTTAIYADQVMMASIDFVVQTWTMGSIGQEELNGLLTAVRDGAGIAGWHGGLVDAFRASPEYYFMVGGKFAAHPGGLVPHTVAITDREDPVTAGVADFAINTEQYYMHVDPNNKVLATTRFNGDTHQWIDGATMPVVWKRMHGKGRVFFSAIGHRMEDHAVPEARTILERGIVWAAQSKVASREDLLRPVYPA